MFSIQRALVATVVIVTACSADAAFVTPAFRGGPDTTYQAWDVFTSFAGPNPPDVALSNPNGMPNLRELTEAGFIPSSGNLYVDGALGDFEVTIPDYGKGIGYETKIIAQIRTQGSTLDLSTVLVDGVAFDSSEKLLELPLGGFGGILQEWKFEWTLPGNTALNTLTFKASSANLSLDRVSVDTQAVAIPEMGSLMLTLTVAAGAGVAAYRRRVRKA